MKQNMTKVRTLSRTFIFFSIYLNMEKICGIYKITSPSGRIYVGQSINIYRRWKEHKYQPKKSRLQASLKKYGIKAHLFEVVIKCNPEELDDFEKVYIKKFNSCDKKTGMNLREGGMGKYTMSAETKLKIGAASKGRKAMLGKSHSEETKEKIRIGNIGKKRSESARKKISEAVMNRTPEQKRKFAMSSKGVKGFKGKSHSAETRAKISNLKKGNSPLSKENLEKLIAINTGRIHTIESRNKMSSNKKKKQIIDTSTGIIYNGYKDVLGITKMKRTTLTSQLCGINKNKTTFKFL